MYTRAHTRQWLWSIYTQAHKRTAIVKCIYTRAHPHLWLWNVYIHTHTRTCDCEAARLEAKDEDMWVFAAAATVDAARGLGDACFSAINVSCAWHSMHTHPSKTRAHAHAHTKVYLYTPLRTPTHTHTPTHLDTRVEPLGRIGSSITEQILSGCLWGACRNDM